MERTDKRGFSRLAGFLMAIIVALLACPLAVEAAYVVHSVSGNVGLVAKGSTTPLKKGMSVGPSDVIDIPENGKLEIFNELDGKVYSSVKSGRFSVIRLMLDAKDQASDNAGNVKGQLALGKGENTIEGRLYMEKGMVKRSQTVFGQDSENVDVDGRTLARYVASVVYTGNLDSRVELPVKIEHERGEGVGIKFRLVNDLDFPVYFNVLKITGSQAPVLEVSELGQPTGCYVVLPGQALSREQFAVPNSDTRHVLIMSHCKYDIGEVIDFIGDLLSTEGIGTLSEKDAPVHMLVL